MPVEPMSQKYQRPDWVRRMNAMALSVGEGAEGARRIVPIDGEQMLAAAEASLGGGSFGDFGDPEWRDRYLQLAALFDASHFHVVGRLQSRQELLRAVRSRLLLGRALDQDPGLADLKVEAPVIVTGPARSGTSITFELLWLDETLRGPTAWEALHPVPLPDAATDQRLAAAECEQEFWADVQPEFAAIHELRSDLPVECVTLNAPSFCGSHWPMVFPASAVHSDPVKDYAFHTRILQVLQRGEPARNWLLKTPGHLMTLDLLLATYPDAWVIQTHRDPAKTIPSTVSTTAMLHWLRTDQVEIEPLAAGIDMSFGEALNQIALRRDRGELPDRFVDIHFKDLLADPVATLGAAYEKMGRPFQPQHAARITQYLAEKPRGKFGTHKYTPEEWGFQKDDLRKRMQPYIETFGVALED